MLHSPDQAGFVSYKSSTSRNLPHVPTHPMPPFMTLSLLRGQAKSSSSRGGTTDNQGYLLLRLRLSIRSIVYFNIAKDRNSVKRCSTDKLSPEASHYSRFTFFWYSLIRNLLHYSSASTSLLADCRKPDQSFDDLCRSSTHGKSPSSTQQPENERVPSQP